MPSNSTRPSGIARVYVRRPAPAGAPARAVRPLRRQVKATEPELWAQWDAVSRGARVAERRSRAATSWSPWRRTSAASSARCSASAPRPTRWRRRRAPTTTCSASRSTSSAAARCRCSRAARTSHADAPRTTPCVERAARPRSARRRASWRSPQPAARCSIAKRRCAPRTEPDKAAVAAEIEALKRWCAAHLHDPRYRGWVIFRFPENARLLTIWSQVQRPRPDAARGDDRARRASCAAATASS